MPSINPELLPRLESYFSEKASPERVATILREAGNKLAIYAIEDSAINCTAAKKMTGTICQLWELAEQLEK